MISGNCEYFFTVHGAMEKSVLWPKKPAQGVERGQGRLSEHFHLRGLNFEMRSKEFDGRVMENSSASRML